MLGKATNVGLIVSSACVAVPVPLRGIVSGEPGALLVIDTLPLAAAAVVGAKVTLKDAV